MTRITYIVIILLFICGCNQCLPLEKVERQKNTFVLKDAIGLIEWVRVYDLSDLNDIYPKLVWHIESKGLVSGNHFVITVPKKPDNFEQVLPVPGEQFTLRKGHSYMIEVYYSSGPTCPGTAKWVAE